MIYDKAWYEIAKQRLGQKNWKYTEFYFKTTNESEIPVCKEDMPYLEKAKEYLETNDLKLVQSMFAQRLKRQSSNIVRIRVLLLDIVKIQKT